MALIVETGAGLADAESYASVAFATAYHAARGNDAWAALASDTIREQHLRKATDHMLSTYRTRWAGYRSTQAQALDWPRAEVSRPDAPQAYGGESYYPNNVVPAEIQRACAELALRSISGPLTPDETQAVKRKKVEGLEIEYADYSRATRSYPAIDRLMAAFLDGFGSIRVSRG
jgi:hypothetical protein